MKKMNIIKKAYKEIYSATKLSAIISPILYFIEGIIPAIITYVLTRLYDLIDLYTKAQTDFSSIAFMALVVVLLYLILIMIQAISAYIVNIGIFEKVQNYCKLKVYNKASGLNLILYEDINIYDLKGRAEDVIRRDTISNLYMNLGIILRSSVSFVSTLIVLAAYNPWFILISFLSVIPFFIAKRIRGNAFYFLKKAQIKKERKLSYLWSLLIHKDSVKEIRTQQTYNYIYDKWKNCKNEVNKEIWNFEKKDALSMFFCDFIKILGYASCVCLSFILVIKGKISIGVFGACLTAFISTQNSIKTLLIRLGGISSLINFSKNYFYFLETFDGEKIRTIDHKFEDSINLNNVHFKYPSNKEETLKEINLDIKRGETVVLVGENGSGKTTLIKLILGIYDVVDGEVTYDEIDLKDIKRDSLYKNISIISQDFNQFQMSLRENIALSDFENINSDNKILETVKMVDEGILENIENIDDILGKEFGGTELSGGQWQKIAISRGLYKNSDLIILDEPTASLDPITEYEILSKFLEISKNKTSIIVSHRIGLCKYADKIIVMDKGRVIGIGKHEQLLQNCLEYKRLYETQQKWYIN